MASAESEAPEGPATGDAQKAAAAAAAARGAGVVAARSTWVRLAVLVAAVQLAGVGAIAGLTYAIVRHHKEVIVVGGALTAQGDPRARPVATSAAMRAWELRHIRLLTVEQLLALRSVTVPLNETAAKVYRIASMEAHGATGGGPPYERVVLHTDTGETLHVTAMRRTRNATGAAHRHAFELPPLPWDDSPLAPVLGAPDNHSAEPSSVVEPAPTMLSLLLDCVFSSRSVFPACASGVSWALSPASERSDGSGRTLELQAQHPDGRTMSRRGVTGTGSDAAQQGGCTTPVGDDLCLGGGAAFYAEDRGVVGASPGQKLCQLYPGACQYSR